MQRTALATLWIAVAVAAPSASYLATLHNTEYGDATTETLDSKNSMSQLARPSMQVVNLGEQQWACVPIPDALTPRLIDMPLMTATGASGTDLLVPAVATSADAAKLN